MSALYVLFVAMPFMVAFALGLALPIWIMLLYTRFSVGLITIGATFVVDALSMGHAGLNLGMNLFLADLGLIPVAAVAGLRLLLAKDFPYRHWGWLVFSVLVALGLVLGLASHGSAAGVQVRPYFYFVAAGLYGMSFPLSQRQVRLAFNILVIVAVVMLLLTVYRWVVYYTPIPALLPPGGTYNVDGPIRVIKSFETLVIAEVLICGLFFATVTRSLRFAQLASPLFLALVVVLQHRSVWLAALIGVMTYFFVARSRQTSATGQVLALVGIVGLTLAPMMFTSQLSEVSQGVASSAERVVQGADTTGERLKNWKSTVELWYHGGPRTIGIGAGFGGDSTRYIDSPGSFGVSKISYYAHNMYVQTLYNTGLIGLGALLAAMAYVLRGLYFLSKKTDGEAEARVLLVLMVMQVAYYVPYGTDYLQGLLFGIALSYVASRVPLLKATGATLRTAEQV